MSASVQAMSVFLSLVCFDSSAVFGMFPGKEFKLCGLFLR